MRRSIVLTFVIAMLAAAGSARAQDAKQAKQEGSDPDLLATRLFAGPVSPDKNYACFVRRYDSAHLARHPLQKVSAMRLLVAAEKSENGPNLSYSFRLGVKFSKRPGDFDSSGYCGTPGIEARADKVVLSCGVDCDGGGISAEFNKENKFALMRLDRISIWRNNKPDDEGLDLSGGADDKVFRLDRAKLDMCKSLITDRKDLAATRTLKK
ncbi:MAG: hypothetical protein ACR2K5_09705 [Pseudolabrys sp.]